MAIKSSARSGAPVVWAVLHTAEGARNTDSLRVWFEQSSTIASSHVGIDADTTEQYVPYARASWTLRAGNPISDNAELCGFAHWTRDQWLSTDTVDGVVNPRAMLDRAAAWLSERCASRGIPLTLLSAADIRAKRPGVMGHWDYTRATGDGTHTDPGTSFPWDYVLSQARARDFLMALTDDQQQQIYNAVGASYVRTGRQLGDAVADIWEAMFRPGWKPPAYGPMLNSVVSGANQLFYDTPTDPTNPDTTPTYGPSINQQLADIRAALEALTLPDDE